MPAALRTPGRGERRDDGARVERPGPAVDGPLDEERQPDREHDDRSGGPSLRIRLLDEQEPAEDQQEDPDPGESGPAGVVGSPLPVVDLDRFLAGEPAAAVGAEVGHGIGLVIHRLRVLVRGSAVA